GQFNPAAVGIDTDGDRLPDEWELANGLDPQQAGGGNGADADPDGDGATNWHEYLAGTDPLNPLDFLRFDSVSVDQAYCTLRFTPHFGRVYSIEARNSLSPSDSWTALRSGITGTQVYTWMDPVTNSVRFYRIGAALAP